MGRQFRMRSADCIFAEIKMLYDQYGIRQIDFADDTLTLDIERLDKLCDLLIKSGFKISWSCNSQVHDKIKPDILKKMKEAGCVRIDFGVESGDPEVLKIIKKNITISQICNAHKYARESGLKTVSFFMIGLPGQDMESIKKSLSLIESIETDFPFFSIATPYPGTELYEIAKKRGWLKTTDWNKFLSIISYDDYEPTMETDKMDQQTILSSYKYVSDYLKYYQIRKKYGKKFYFNPCFYKEKIFSMKSKLL